MYVWVRDDIGNELLFLATYKRCLLE